MERSKKVVSPLSGGVKKVATQLSLGSKYSLTEAGVRLMAGDTSSHVDVCCERF